MYRLLAPILILAALLVAPTASAVAAALPAPPGMPPKGKVLLGVGGHELTPTTFDRMTGAKHDIHLVSVNWNESREGGWAWALDSKVRDARKGGYRLMIHIAPNTNAGTEGRSPGAVARGLADRYLISFGQYVNATGEYVYVRPPAEMNGHWSLWAAYNRNGSKRNADHSTTNYRRAFIRMALISRGGEVAKINASLRRNGMPPLNTSATNLTSSGKISTVFNPQARGAPDVRGNQPWDYYPGKYVVDYVANDLYVQRGKAAWAAHDALYKKYAPTHPFMVAEYAPWGYDDPAFVKRMFQWVAARPRTVALMYFNGTGKNTFFLSKKPRSLAMYKSHAKAARYSCPGITATWHLCTAEPAQTVTD
ncbi:MAG: Beta-mannanase-like [Thermoleophilia bacterium]|nr:Beta-mannanase-like [Thermoleophilia bacterium]